MTLDQKTTTERVLIDQRGFQLPYFFDRLSIYIILDNFQITGFFEILFRILWVRGSNVHFTEFDRYLSKILRHMLVLSAYKDVIGSVIHMVVIVDMSLCTGCGQCVDTCPVEALSLGSDDIVIADADLCVDCGQCIDVCPVEALS